MPPEQRRWLRPRTLGPESLWGRDGSERTDVYAGNSRYRDQDLARVFKSSADLLVEALSKELVVPPRDDYAWPILYLYRHALELQLKEVLDYGLRLHLIQLTDRVKKLTTNEHRLLDLWSEAKRVLGLAKLSYPRGQLEQVEGYVTELHEADPNGQRFRYQGRKQQLPAVERLPENFGLVTLAYHADRLYWSLEGSICDLDRQYLNSDRASQPGA